MDRVAAIPPPQTRVPKLEPVLAAWSKLAEGGHGGIELTDLSIAVHPWPPESAVPYGIEEQSDFPLTDQLQVFGGNLGDDVWTFWLQRGQLSQPSPVLVIADHDAYSIHSAGELAQFLTLETAIGLVLAEPDPAVTAALTALKVPEGLRAGSTEETQLVDALARWADPSCGEEGYYRNWGPMSRDDLSSLGRDLP